MKARSRPSSAARRRRRLDPRRLHRDEGGAISFIAVIGAVAMAMLLGMIVHTGDQAAQKIDMQNAADAAALSGGAWIARGLNVISAFNVLESQLVSGALLLSALDHTLQLSEPIVHGQNVFYAGCIGVPFVGAFCLAGYLVTGAQLLVLRPVLPIVDSLADYLARCESGLFWTLAGALELLSDGVHHVFFGIAFAEGLTVAERNGVSFAAFVPGVLFHQLADPKAFFLPTIKQPFSVLCDPMREGSPNPSERGYHSLLEYEVGKGPFLSGLERVQRPLLLITGVPPVGSAIFSAIAEALYDQVCSGKPYEAPEYELDRTDPDLEDCRAADGIAYWHQLTIDAETTSPEECETLSEVIPDPPEVEPCCAEPDVCRTRADQIAEEYRQQIEDRLHGDDRIEWWDEDAHGAKSCDWTPPGERKNATTWEDVTVSGPYGGGEQGGGTYDCTVDIYALTSTEFTSTEVAEHPDPERRGSPLGSERCDAPQPRLLMSDWEQRGRLRYLMVVQRPNESAWFAGDYVSEPPDLFAYAEVEIYNGVNEDAFAQDWRVHLKHAALIEAPFEAIGDHELIRAMESFVSRYLDIQDIGPFEWVNNH